MLMRRCGDAEMEVMVVVIGTVMLEAVLEAVMGAVLGGKELLFMYNNIIIIIFIIRISHIFFI